MHKKYTMSQKSLKTKIEKDQIESFLEGRDPQKYIVAVEATYNEPKVSLIINDPSETGKRIEECKFKPFLWFKEEITKLMYNGNRGKMLESCQRFGVKITRLKINDADGKIPDRLEYGYKFMATCTKSYNDLINYFKQGGVDVFSKEYQKYFVMFSPVEQFMIQTGKRLFKGMDDYSNLHRLQFDLETEGLFASKHAIFQIGIRDNKDIELVFETKGDTLAEKRNSERENIEKFFKVIDIMRPDLITGYNSESFDWPFLFERCERLGIEITDMAITLNRYSKIKRKASTVKLGGETEAYMQTNMWGHNIIDISHSVRRAMAINSEIKGWGLKYITKYSEIAKPNRVYVPGDKINTTWADKVNDFAFNNDNGDWYIITPEKPLKDGYEVKKGDFIVQRYLQDDLWETEQIDNIFNQAAFLIGKIIPTNFQRSSTMGTAGQWKLIMAAWSYENGLGIPENQEKIPFTGGLARLLAVGYAKNVVKLDYAALYPKTQLTHGIFPELDISGVMEGILTYVVDTRDHFKFLTGTEKKLAKKLAKRLEDEELTLDEISHIKNEISKHKALSNLYDKKQLPLKILANSWFGSYGAPHIFNWGDINSAEETTCRGRQYLRQMVKHFTEKHGFRALVGDTDGFNFSFPDNIDDIKYTAIGNHWKTKEDAGKELSGLDAVLAEFNELHMQGRMGLDIDDICNSTINFARKNYANDIGGKIKLVGNSIKSKKMSVYIEDFLGGAIRMLLDGDGKSFIQHYYDYVDKIYNYQIPLVKIASKAKVKISIPDYKRKAKLTNKKGNPLPKQAHMELAIRKNMEVNLGDTLYYINTGTAKSHGDLKSEKNKDTGLVNVVLNCDLVSPEILEKDFESIKEMDMLKKTLSKLDETSVEYDHIKKQISDLNDSLYMGEYNVPKYLDAFNKKVKPLLVCFNEEVRSQILLDIVKIKNKETKKTTEKLKERNIFTKGECELILGVPNKPTDQDSYEDLMKMEDKEIKFWNRVKKVPNDMDEGTWEEIRKDYLERMEILRIENEHKEHELYDDLLKTIELNDYSLLNEQILPDYIDKVIIINKETGFVESKKLGINLSDINGLFKYYKEASERDKYYQLVGCENSASRYQQYVDYLIEQKAMSGETINVDIKVAEKIVDLVKIKETNKKTEELPKKKELSEDEDEEEDIEIDENGNLIRKDEILKLDDEVDDTKGEMPEDYIIGAVNKPIKEDGFPF